MIGGSTKNCTVIGQLIGDAVLRSAIRQFQPELGKLGELGELGGNSSSYKNDRTDRRVTSQLLTTKGLGAFT